MLRRLNPIRPWVFAATCVGVAGLAAAPSSTGRPSRGPDKEHRIVQPSFRVVRRQVPPSSFGLTQTLNSYTQW